jgi:GH25 family lysozyme M1 (1,4-beta-N-acetylmuramidase)
LSRPLIIDVSNNNPIDAGQLRVSGAVALTCKATEGTGFVDKTYPTHRKLATQAQIPFGGYLFLLDDSDGSEAEYFLEHAGPRRGDLQPIVDAETGVTTPEAHRAYRCLSSLDDKGYRPILYSSWSYLRQMLKVEPRLARFRVWEAAYGVLRPRVGMGTSVCMWQFSDRYPVQGGRYDASRLLVPLDVLRIPHSPA